MHDHSQTGIFAEGKFNVTMAGALQLPNWGVQIRNNLAKNAPQTGGRCGLWHCIISQYGNGYDVAVQTSA